MQPINGPLSKIVLAFAVVFALLIWRLAPAAVDPGLAREPEDEVAMAHAIVQDYRRILVLLADRPPEVPDAERARMLGQYLFFRNLARSDRLVERMTSALDSAAMAQHPPAELESLLTDIETGSEYRDADKLAFCEVLAAIDDHIRDDLSAAPYTPALSARLHDDLQALQDIQHLYEKEIAKVLSQISVRGISPRRESWESYLTFVKTHFDRAGVLREFQQLALDQPQVRGRKPAKSRVELNGSALPPRTLVLTFDDGPHPRYTERILDVLVQANVPAIFFELGQNIGAMKADGTITPTRAARATKRILELGYPLGNHSFSHPVLPGLSQAEIKNEIEWTNKILEDVTQSAPVMFRAPYGARNQAILSTLDAHKLKSIMWNIDSEDWADPIPASIAARVLDEVEKEKHGIILFHDIHERTVEALPLVIDSLKKAGYRFATWDGQKFVVVDSQTTSRGMASSQRPEAPQPYRQSWAVVIGIDDYAKWPKLRYAVNDARAIRDLLIRRYQFKPENIFLLLDRDATRENILSVLGDKLANPQLVKHDDRVFVFFAGHGATRRLPSGRDLGYIVPVETDINSFHGQAISMTNFQDISEAIPAKHLLFVMDSCYSGLALTRGSSAAGGQNFLQEISRRSARQMLTAGGADQQVADTGPNSHSVFTWTLMQALEGKADLNGDGVITASEIAAYAAPTVSALSQQTPAFGNLPGSEGGDFVFELRHEDEYLNEQSAELDHEAIQLNAEIERLRAEVTRKEQRNQRMKEELARAHQALEPQSDEATVPKALESAAALNDRGTALFREKKYAEALEAFKAAAKLDPQNALAANNLGFAYFKLDNQVEAVRWFEQALQIDPRRAIAWYNLGDAYLRLGRTDDARRAFEQFLVLQPNAKLAAQAREKLEALAAPH